MNLENIIKSLENIVDLLKKENVKPPVQETKVPEAVPEKLSDFAQLKALLESAEWPQAAPDFLICEETEKDKMERAEGIVSYLGQEFKDQKFPDWEPQNLRDTTSRRLDLLLGTKKKAITC